VPADAQLLARVPFLAALSDADRGWLAQRVKRRAFSRGEVIFNKEDPGQALFVVQSGSVRIFVPGAQGNDLTLAIMGPGDFFGDLSLLDGSPRSASAAALADSVVLILDRADFTSLVRSRPEAAMSVLSVLARRLRDVDQMASDLAFQDVGARLARKLLDLAETNGVRRQDGIAVDVPVTQEELANMIGVTRESVNRSLAAFRKQGIIARDGRRLLIRNEAALRERTG
jgi:CRP/FNR family transcriptional regulator/CRP/FNR family cyclic AMP-dependent transcriptional regulator